MRSNPLFPLLVTSLLPGFAALGAPNPSAVVVWMSSCEVERHRVLHLANQDLTINADYNDVGHQLTWLDEDKTFTMTTGQFIQFGKGFPELSLLEITASAGAGTGERILDKISTDFNVDASYQTQSVAKHRQWRERESGANEVVLSDVTAAEEDRWPDCTQVTTAVAGGGSKVVLTALAPFPAQGRLQDETFAQTCTTTPAALSEIKFEGFFSRVGSKITMFDASFRAAVDAKQKLAACLAQGANPHCADLQAKASAAEAAREKVWGNLLKSSDLVSPPPPDDNSPPVTPGNDDDGIGRPVGPGTCQGAVVTCSDGRLWCGFCPN